MENEKSNKEYFDESQSFQVINEMIQVSQKKLKNDGILMWGWIFFITHFFCSYFPTVVELSELIRNFLSSLKFILQSFGFGYTLYYLFLKKKGATTYIDISLRYVWISLFFSLVLVNVIQFNILHQINFELQHPIFMIIIAFAIVVTGGILRYKMITVGGIIFAIFGFISSYLPLPQQLLLESIAWVIAFIIPGHILFSQRNK